MVIPIDPYGSGKNWRKVTIEILSDDTLLEVFDFYRLHAEGRSRGRPWKWQYLAHVCQRWRHVIYASPRRLDLRILCKSGKPIERVLRAWSTLPLVVGFWGTPKSKSLPKNVAIALCQAVRVCEIDLGVTAPIIKSISSVMQVPFPALEHIQIRYKDNAEPVVIDEFLGRSAPRLKTVHVEGIAIPFSALRLLLLSTKNLVELFLQNIPKSCYFSPNALVTILTNLGHLKKLDIRFRPPASRSTTDMEPPLLECPTFPSLISLGFRGASEYMEAFAARTYLPALTTLSIAFFNQAIFEIPQLNGFISRVEGLKSFNHISITLAENAVWITFYRKEKRGYRIWGQNCNLSISCRRLDWQLSFTTQIFNQLSPLISSAKVLIIYKPYAMSAGREDVDPAQWLELFQPLPHLSEVRVDVEELVPDIVHALVNQGMAAGVLPGLTSLYLEGYQKSPSTIDAAKRFVDSRKLANHNIFLRG